MFKKLLDKVLRPLADAQSQRDHFLIDQGARLAKKEIDDLRAKIELDALNAFVGKKIITISNHWTDMVIGTVTGVTFITLAQQPVLEFQDAITKRKLITFGKVYLFDIETLNALLKLDPYERWNLKVPHAPIPWDSPKDEEITPPDVFLAKLKAVGFI